MWIFILEFGLMVMKDLYKYSIMMDNGIQLQDVMMVKLDPPFKFKVVLKGCHYET